MSMLRCNIEFIWSVKVQNAGAELVLPDQVIARQYDVRMRAFLQGLVIYVHFSVVKQLGRL